MKYRMHLTGNEATWDYANGASDDKTIVQRILFNKKLHTNELYLKFKQSTWWYRLRIHCLIKGGGGLLITRR